MTGVQTYSVPESKVAGEKDLIIIGGGSTASTLIIRLADQIAKSPEVKGDFSVHCFDENRFANGGLAYGKASKHHILNSIRTEMSPWNPDSFHDYCVAREKGDLRDSFNSRCDYRDFLIEEVLNAISYLQSRNIRVLNNNCNVRLIKAQDGIDVVHDKYGFILLRGCNVRQIVLATGYGPNLSFEGLHERLGPDRYVHTLYDAGSDGVFTGSLISEKHNPHIVFLGSGPALYDCINDLYGAGITSARLTVISASSHRPLSVRNLSIEKDEKNILPERLLSLDSEASAEDILNAVINDFGAATSKRRVSLDILSHLSSALKGVAEEEAEKFLQSSTISLIRHAATPVPLESYCRLSSLKPVFIQSYISGDEISVCRKGLLSIRKGDIEVSDIDMIINGTGHGRHTSSILETMKKHGLARVHKGLGILETQDDGYSLRGSGIACIGPATHLGCDGVESFDIPVRNFVRNFVGCTPVP